MSYASCTVFDCPDGMAAPVAPWRVRPRAPLVQQSTNIAATRHLQRHGPLVSELQAPCPSGRGSP